MGTQEPIVRNDKFRGRCGRSPDHSEHSDKENKEKCHMTQLRLLCVENEPSRSVLKRKAKWSVLKGKMEEEKN